MDTQPLVSIGLPVYNGQKYLEQSIDSILSQTFPAFELIISDNASTDQTQSICQRVATQDRRVRYYRNETNIGAAPNFNRVVEFVSAPYFRWASYDDFLAPDLLSKCLEVLETHPEVMACYPRVRLVDEHGHGFENYDPIPNTCSIERPSQRFREFILHPHLALQLYSVFRTEILKKTLLHQSYPASDEVLLAELSLLGKFSEIPDRLFYNRVHAEQSTKGPLTAQRSRLSWIDPRLSRKTVLPHWLYFLGCFRVIRRAPIRPAERAICYLTMLEWLTRPSHFRALGKDVLLAGQKLAASAVSPAP